ncbi:NADPH:quinone reductase-like Zn-dependent oxidoreductase [Mucilaginibacter rubeus]|uniref:NADP-dependent oxidoreductase n=1 Tax=Mucilaginibacter rubeus TaxID=2027860 RepID=UPI003394D92A
MKAIILKDFGGVENLVPAEIPVPTIAADEVLVKLKAISINPVDVKTRSGKGVAGLIKDESPIILGWDISGEITEVGADVTGFKPGDEVFAMINFPKTGKAYAEYVKAKANELALKPAGVSHEEAAAATLAALTAWQAFHSNASVKPGDRVLIHAASGGVGHYAVQIAKHLGAYVIATSSAANRDFVLGLGADEHIDYKAQPFETATGDIDFVLDTIGGEYIDRSLQVMKKGGTIISIVSGMNETVTPKANALGINGHNTMVKPNAENMATIAGLLQKGIIKSHISKVFPFEQMADAHLQLESGRTVGKVVLVF